MSTAHIEITGLTEMRQRLSADVIRTAVLRGLRTGLRPVASLAAALAPRRTGALAASVRSSVGNRRGEITGAIISGMPYGHLVEEGHRIVTGGRVQRAGRFTPLSKIGRFKGSITGQVPGQHFARMAFETDQGGVTAAVEAELQRAIEGAP